MSTYQCRSCGSSIIWGTTANGKSIPLDAKGEKRFFIGKSEVAHLVDTYSPHHATCPQGKEWKKS